MSQWCIVLSCGSWGGVYIHWELVKRISIGWFSLTLIPDDFDTLFSYEDILEGLGEDF